MANTGIVIEIENNIIKETSLGVMAAAAGTRVFAHKRRSDMVISQMFL